MKKFKKYSFFWGISEFHIHSIIFFKILQHAQYNLYVSDLNLFIYSSTANIFRRRTKMNSEQNIISSGRVSTNS